MKRLLTAVQVMAAVAIAFSVGLNVHALNGEESNTQEVDTRAMSQSYWLKMARLGLVEVEGPVAVEQGVYTSSEIVAPGVLAQDSPDVPVTTDTSTTQTENSVFVHPNDIFTVLNSNNSSEWDGTWVPDFYGANAFFSTDGGQVWDGSVEGVGGENKGDPAAVIGLNGLYYVGHITEDGGQGVAHSTDNGSTWTGVHVATGGELLDKNHLWIDNNRSSPYEGNLYTAWTFFDLGEPDDGEIELSRSTDDGLSWSTPMLISTDINAGSHNQGVNIQTGPDGEVYVVWAVYDFFPQDETALAFTKSTNGGVTFEPATRIIEDIRGIRDTWTSKNMRVNSFPVMTVDNSCGPDRGAIYVVWTNIGVPGINEGPDIDIYLIKSTDGGSTWSTPLRVNQDPSGLGKEHYIPWITSDPVTGDLSVIFYDDRNVDSTDCEVFVATSEDGGENWTDFKVSDVSFTPSPIPGLAFGYFGDYLGITARDGQVYPTWTDNRNMVALTYVSPFVMSKEIEFDIKPQSCPNPFNSKSKGKVPVAILSTDDFDATTVDPTTVRLEGVEPLRWALHDVGTPVGPESECCECSTEPGDGFLDLALKFETQDLVAALGPFTEGEVRVLTITGETFDGMPIKGRDCMVVIH